MQENQEIEFTTEDFVGFIHKFSNDYCVQYIKERDKTKSMMEVCGVLRKENNHSDFLAWLFDSSSDHKLGALPADKLIKLLANIRCVLNSLADAVGNELSNDELLSFLTNSNEIIESKTYREVCGAKGRVDIVLDLTAKVEPTKIRVVFENKITATETNGDQTCRYYKEFSSKNDGYKNIYVYNRCKKSSPKCWNFVCTTYQDLVDHVIDPLLKIPNISERTKFILEDYILSLEKVSSDRETLNTNIMAIGESTKKIITDFWKNNSELISKIIKALKLSDPNNEEYQQLDTAVENARNYDKYAVNGDGRYGKSRLVEAVVNLYILNHPEVTADELKSVFPEHLTPLGVVKTFGEGVKDEKRWYKATLKNGEQFYISNQWGINNILDFIDYVHANIAGIKITKVE